MSCLLKVLTLKIYGEIAEWILPSVAQNSWKFSKVVMEFMWLFWVKLASWKLVYWGYEISGFREALLDAINEFKNRRDWGMFIDSCFIHCQSMKAITWHSPSAARINNRVSPSLFCCRRTWPFCDACGIVSESEMWWTDGRWSGGRLVLWSEGGEGNRLWISLQPDMLQCGSWWALQGRLTVLKSFGDLLKFSMNWLISVGLNVIRIQTYLRPVKIREHQYR